MASISPFIDCEWLGGQWQTNDYGILRISLGFICGIFSFPPSLCQFTFGSTARMINATNCSTVNASFDTSIWYFNGLVMP